MVEVGTCGLVVCALHICSKVQRVGVSTPHCHVVSRQEIGVGWVGEPCKRLRIDPIVLSPALWQIVKLISRQVNKI